MMKPDDPKGIIRLFLLFCRGAVAADAVVDGLHRQALDDRGEEHDGVGTAEDDVVGRLREHILGTHGERHRKSASQSAPRQERDESEAAEIIGYLADDQRREREARRTGDQVGDDRGRGEQEHMLHPQNADERDTEEHIQHGVEEHVQRLPEGIKDLRVVLLLRFAEAGAQLREQDTADDRRDRAREMQRFTQHIRQRHRQQADEDLQIRVLAEAVHQETQHRYHHADDQRAEDLAEHHADDARLLGSGRGGHHAREADEQRHADAVVEQRLALDQEGGLFRQTELPENPRGGDRIGRRDDTAEHQADGQREIQPEEHARAVHQQTVERRAEQGAHQRQHRDLTRLLFEVLELHVAGACEQHEAQHTVHQEIVDIEILYLFENAADLGTVERRYAHQYQNTDNGREQHQRDLIGQLGDLLVEESEDTDHRNNADEHEHGFHLAFSPLPSCGDKPSLSPFFQSNYIQ